MTRWLLTLILAVVPVQASATIYYLSPAGNNGNDGVSAGTPWLTFSHAFATMASGGCGHTLTLLNGTYGDGTSTGKININGLTCTVGNELRITAQNQRQAKIFDNGTGYAIRIQNSSHLILDGLYSRSTDNNYLPTTTAELGETFVIQTSNHITVRNTIAVNPNRYGNNHAFVAYRSQDILFEDNEAYIFGRHCVSGGESERVVVRRQYCNPRGGKIAGGFSVGGMPLGSGDSVITMYPCKDCILENSIADGTESPMFLNEMNANYGFSVEMSGSKVLGSICYKCNAGNGIFPNSRSVADLNHTPQNLTIKDVALVDWGSASQGIKCQDCVGATVDHVTILGTGTTGSGINAFDSSTGGTAAQNSITVTNTIVRNTTATGLSISGHNTWSGDEIYNNSGFSPALPANWTNTNTGDPGLGTCKVYVPDGAAVKGAGTGGSDIGANILYRYVDGVLTDIPLWDTTTGEFPHGAADPDGVNRVAGTSIHDIHTRLNVNTGGCSFPASYGATVGPTNPAGYVRSTDLTGAHTRTISATANRSLTVAATVIYSGSGTPAHATSVTSSCGGQDIPPLAAAVITGTTSGHRSLRTFGKIDANSGTCTLTLTFSSGNVSGWVMESIEELNVGSYGTVSAMGYALTNNPTVTATVDADHTILAFVGTSNTMALSAGPNQTLTTDYPHGSVALRLATSTQSGADGGFVSYVFGSSKAAAIAAVPLIPPAPGGGSGSTFRVSNYRIDNLHGTTATPEVSLGPLAPQNTPAGLGAAGSFRLRAEVIVENATSTETGVHPYCKKVGGGFVRVENTFGSGVVRFYGAGAEPTIPASKTLTTQRFTGLFAPGWTSRTSELAITLPIMSAGTRTELDYQFTLGNGLVAGDVGECEIRRDDGSTLGTHTFPLQFNVVGPTASMGF